MGAKQIPFDLGHRAAHGREDFMIADCNAEAVAWIDGWREWPGQALILYGLPASGKTHLVQVWRAMSGAPAISATELAEPRLGDAALAIEDMDRVSDEQSVLHTINALREGGGPLLLTGRTPPSLWNILLPDLRSRMLAINACAIELPDDQLLGAVMVKLFVERQLRVPEEVIQYLLPRMGRSLAAARSLVTAIDRLALQTSRSITVPLAREVLTAQVPDDSIDDSDNKSAVRNHG